MDLHTIGIFVLGLSFGVLLGMVIAPQMFDAEMVRRRDEAGEREERWYSHVIDPEHPATHAH
jgi:MFS superfamily sulfate permease-like transporter